VVTAAALHSLNTQHPSYGRASLHKQMTAGWLNLWEKEKKPKQLYKSKTL